MNNITISINNDTGIVTLTPDGNFTGVRNTIFTAIDIGNLTIPSNNVTLNVTPVNDPPTIDTFTPTELTPTIVLGNSLTFNHTSSDVDGDTLAYSWKLDSTEKSTEQGWKYTPISNEIGTHNVTLNVSDGVVQIDDIPKECSTLAVASNETALFIETGEIKISENEVLVSESELPEGDVFISVKDVKGNPLQGTEALLVNTQGTENEDDDITESRGVTGETGTVFLEGITTGEYYVLVYSDGFMQMLKANHNY